jgi:hypothetical protein
MTFDVSKNNKDGSLSKFIKDLLLLMGIYFLIKLLFYNYKQV